MHTSLKTLNAYRKQREYGVSLAFDSLMKKYQSLHKRIVTLRTIYTMKTQTHNKQAF